MAFALFWSSRLLRLQGLRYGINLVIGGIVALGLGLYLIYALIHPEKF